MPRVYNAMRSVQPVKSITPNNRRGKIKSSQPKLKTFNRGKTAKLK